MWASRRRVALNYITCWLGCASHMGAGKGVFSSLYAHLASSRRSDSSAKRKRGKTPLDFSPRFPCVRFNSLPTIWKPCSTTLMPGPGNAYSTDNPVFSPFPSALIKRWRLQIGEKYRLLAHKMRLHCRLYKRDHFCWLTLGPYWSTDSVTSCCSL